MCKFDLSSIPLDLYKLSYFSECDNYIEIQYIEVKENFALLRVTFFSLNIENLESLTEIQLKYSHNLMMIINLKK